MAPPIIVDDLEVKRGGWTSIELSGNQYSPLQIPEAASESLGSLVSSVLTILYTTVCIETEDNTNGNGHEAFLMFLYNNYPPPLKSNMGHWMVDSKPASCCCKKVTAPQFCFEIN